MQTLIIQIPNDQDYELFLSLAYRLNCKIISNLNEDIAINEEMKAELDRRLELHDQNPEEGYSLEDVRIEVEERLGIKREVRKIFKQGLIKIKAHQKNNF